MPKISAQDNYIRVGDTINSFAKIKTGEMAISVEILYKGKSYPQYCAILQPSQIQGLEFIFQQQKIARYSLLATKTTEVEAVSLLPVDLYKKNTADLMQLFLSYKPTLASIADTKTIVDNIFNTGLQVFYSFFAAIGDTVKKYQFNVENPLIEEILLEVNNYISQHRWEDKVYPLSDELYSIPFKFFDPYYKTADFLNTFYVKRMLQLLAHVQSGLGKDKVFMLNFLMDMALKSEQIVISTQEKLQYIVNKLEIFLSEHTLKMVRTFLQNAEKSQEISNYLFFVTKSAVSFIEIKVLQPLYIINPDLAGDLVDGLRGYKDLLEKLQDKFSSPSASSDVKKVAIPTEFMNSVTQILDYSALDGDFKSKFLEEYNKWKMSPTKLSPEGDIAKVRKRITEYFWQIYTACFKQHKLHHQSLIKPVELMFKYGYFDENLVAGNLLKALIDRAQESFQDADLKIYNTYDWLISVCDEVNNPSNSKTGEMLDVTLRELAKEEEQNTGTRPDPKKFNTLEFRIDYEIDNFIRESVKICNGSFSTYVPILLDEQVPVLDLTSQYLTPAKLTRTFLELKKLDFSAFYREVRYKAEGVEEFIQKEVLPMFILMPGVGGRSLVWQPKERLKDTSARIAFPFLSFAKEMESMIYTFGFYRWEIVKDILGPSWNDISLLSLTSDYSDYESSYKSSKDIDDETKEKVAIEFKKFRNTRDRFINDYGKWILVDSQGRPGVNKAVRELFYRHIPFPKDVRAKLVTLPAYEPYNDRYVILLKKELARIKLKFQKYQDADGTLPPELEAYIQFIIK